MSDKKRQRKLTHRPFESLSQALELAKNTGKPVHVRGLR